MGLVTESTSQGEDSMSVHSIRISQFSDGQKRLQTGFLHSL
jgi:hypothetical protein